MQLRIALVSLLVASACAARDTDVTHNKPGTLVISALDPELGIQGTFVSSQGVALTYSITRTNTTVTGFVKNSAGDPVAEFSFAPDKVAMKFAGVPFDPDHMKNPTAAEVAFAKSAEGLAVRELGRTFSDETAEDEALAAKLRDFGAEVSVLGMVTNMGNTVDPGGLVLEQRPKDISAYTDTCQSHNAPYAWYLQDGHEDQLSDDLRPGYYGTDGPCFGLCGSGCSCVAGTCRYTNSCWNHDYVTANYCNGSHWECFKQGYNDPFSSNYWNPNGGFGCALNSALGGSACNSTKMGIGS